jgi:uncharacterized protein YtpQ (UPF0354 family)
MGLFSRKRPPEESSEAARDQFAAEVLDAVLATGLVRSARYDPGAFSIVYEKSGTGTIYLHNTYLETSGVDADERAERIQRLITILGSSAGEMSWAQARPNLRPVLRGVSFGQNVPGATTVDNQSADTRDRRLLARPALPYLNEFVVVDEPTSMAYVTQARLTEWGVTPDEVFAAARENLTPGAAAITGPAAAGNKALLRFVDDGNGYFTSMLLLDGFLAGLADHVGGRPVAFIADKDSLLVTADDPDGLPALFKLVEEEFGQAVRSISPAAYTVDDAGRVVPYRGPAGSAVARAAHRAEVLLASSEYASQKEALEARFEAEGNDIFVGSVLVAQRPDESVFSVAVWGSDVDTLLPEADFVALQGDQEQLTVPIAVAVAEASLVPEPDYVPIRYRVTAWPPEAVLARLRALSVSP